MGIEEKQQQQERARIELFIRACSSLSELSQVEDVVKEYGLSEAYQAKTIELQNNTPTP
jgi:hypothetical protein